MSYLDIVRAQLKVDENIKSKPYRDTVGKWTIGVGRNLDDVGLRPKEIDLLLENDIEEAESTARTLFPTFDSLSDARKAVLVNMSFNLGLHRLAGFVRFREAVANGQFEAASRHMLDSGWASQVGNRAVRLAKQMKDG
jgi:lysozyme